MSKLQGKRVLIFQQRNWGKIIGRYLAKRLAEEGAILGALTFKRSVHDLIKEGETKYELIINNDEVMADPKKYLGDDDYNLTEICDQLGVDSLWPLIYTLRNHVKSYQDKYYYSFKQNVSDEEIGYFVKAVYKYIKFFFSEFKPDVIISPNFVALPHIMFNLYAHRRGVKMFGLTDSKVRGVYIFTYGYRDDAGPFYERVDALNASGAKSQNQERAEQYIADFRREFKKPDYANYESGGRSLMQRLRRELLPYYQVLLWYTKPGISRVNYLKSTGITIDYRPPKIILRDHWAEKSYRKFADTFNYYPFDQVGKLVYFPLQFQPEATIDVISPNFSNQIETARQVAMSLPGDYTLVVKEHPGMVGKRPPSYLEKISRTVNVKLIDYRIPSQEILKRAALVVSPSSTTIAEAAFFNKPAIQLGNLGTTLKLPNVFRHTDMTTLARKIQEVLAVNLNNPEYERRLVNFVAAAYDTGLEVDYVSLWEGRRMDLLDQLWQDYKKELARVL